MGLDVYLYWYEDQSDFARREDEYEAQSSAIWAKQEGTPYEHMTDEQKEECRAEADKARVALNIPEWNEETNQKRKVEIDHPDYPDHICKIGYFRSSYNDGGTNAVLRNLISKDVGDVFPGHEDAYCFSPDWQAAKVRVNDLLDQFDEATAKVGNLKVFKTSENLFGPMGDEPADEKAALQVAVEQMARAKTRDASWGDSYSCGGVEFFIGEKGLMVRALIHGRDATFSGLLGQGARPVTYVVYEQEDAYKFYRQSLEIVAATIDYVLGQPDPEHYFLHWSG